MENQIAMFPPVAELLRGIRFHRVVYTVPHPGPHPEVSTTLLGTLGARALDINDFERTIQRYMDAGRLDRLLALEWRALGRAHASVRDFDTANDCLNELERHVLAAGGPRRDPFLAGIARHRAWICFQRREYTEALQRLGDALAHELSPYNLQLVLCVLVRLGAFDEVRQLMDTVRRESPVAFLEALLDGIRADPDLVILNA